MRTKTVGLFGVVLALSLIGLQRVSASEGFDDLVRFLKANDETVHNYLRTSRAAYDFTPDEIVYLHDMGVPDRIIQHALNHGKKLRELADNPPVVRIVVAPPPDETNMTLFFDALEPYGDWIEVDHTWVWRPEVASNNPNWRPYCDKGSWVYTDAGWAWHSEYPWGWAPFHYGRWKNNPQFGWLWTPDNVWAPAWVSWRTDERHYGWAPLPPTARFEEGVGFQRAHIEINFGLSEHDYSFVPVEKICEPELTAHVIPPTRVTNVYNNTTIIQNNITYNDHRVIVRGPPIERTREATHRDIVQVHITDKPVQTGEAIKGNTLTQNTFAVYRPTIKNTTPVNTDLVLARRKAAEQQRETTQALKVEKIENNATRTIDRREADAAAKQKILDARTDAQVAKKEETAAETAARIKAREQALKIEADARQARLQEETRKQAALAAVEQARADAKAKADAAQREALEAKRTELVAEAQAKAKARQEEEAKKQAEAAADAQARVAVRAKAEAAQREEEQAKAAARAKAEAAQRDAQEAKRAELAADVQAKAKARQEEEAKKQAEAAADAQARAAAREKTKEAAATKREDRKEAIAERTPEVGVLAVKPGTAAPEITAILIQKQFNPDKIFNLVATGDMAAQIDALAKKGARARVRGKVAGDTITVESVEEVKTKK